MNCIAMLEKGKQQIKNAIFSFLCVMKNKIVVKGLTLISIAFLFSSCSNQMNTNQQVNQEVKKDTIPLVNVPVEKDPLWKELSHDSFKELDTVNIHYKSYKLFALDSLEMQSLLLKAPKENQLNIDSLKRIVELPRPDGGFSKFSMYATSVMDPALEAKYPLLKTYGGKGVDDRTASVRLEFNQNGFHAYIKSLDGEWFIQPAAQGITHQYLLCFFKQDAVQPNRKSFEEKGSPKR